MIETHKVWHHERADIKSMLVALYVGNSLCVYAWLVLHLSEVSKLPRGSTNPRTVSPTISSAYSAFILPAMTLSVVLVFAFSRSTTAAEGIIVELLGV